MGVVYGWVAFALAGVAVAPHSERNHAQVTYNVRMMEADGVGWREAVFTSLKPVTRQGAATVWTLPREAMPPLLRDLEKSSTSIVLQSPKVTALAGAAATIQHRANQPFISRIAWNDQTPAPTGMAENVRVGWHTTMIGRKLDQGILVQVVFEETAVRAVHHVNVNRPTHSGCSHSASAAQATKHEPVGPGKIAVTIARYYSELVKPDEKATDDEKCAESESCDDARGNKGDDAGVQKVVLDVPEIDTQEVVGEWLIPHGEVLLISFGAHTQADAAGKAVVRERLALIEAAPAGEMVRVSVPSGPIPMVNLPVPRMPDLAPKVALPMPTPIMPSRSIPKGFNADGTPAEMPPLPADEAEMDSSESDSSEPRPSPQTKKVTPPKPATDTGTNKAEFSGSTKAEFSGSTKADSSAANKMEFSLPKAASMFLPSFLMPGTAGGFQFLLPIKPLSVRLPFGQKLEIEILGKIVTETETETQ
jgi:hypothetical protein